MTIIEVMLIVLFLLIFISRQQRKPRSFCRTYKVTESPIPKSFRPVTPEPDYICENCGMLVKTGHGHTREECEEYDKDPTKPDLTLRRVIKERTRPGRNDPKIRKPYYRVTGTFKNLGRGK